MCTEKEAKCEGGFTDCCCALLIPAYVTPAEVALGEAAAAAATTVVAASDNQQARHLKAMVGQLVCLGLVPESRRAGSVFFKEWNRKE